MHDTKKISDIVSNKIYHAIHCSPRLSNQKKHRAHLTLRIRKEEDKYSFRIKKDIDRFK